MMKILRRAYRSFQTDADWEWPFTKDALSTINRRFVIEEIQGTYGKSKWAIPLGFIAPARARRYANRWHRKDLDTRFDLENVTSCLRVSMMLRKRPAADSSHSSYPTDAGSK